MKTNKELEKALRQVARDVYDELVEREGITYALGHTLQMLQDRITELVCESEVSRY